MTPALVAGTGRTAPSTPPSARLAAVSDPCRHGRVGSCVQCSPWCPRDVSPEWVAEFQPVYEQSIRETHRRIDRLERLRAMLNGVPDESGELVPLITTEQFLELLEKV